MIFGRRMAKQGGRLCDTIKHNTRSIWKTDFSSPTPLWWTNERNLTYKAVTRVHVIDRFDKHFQNLTTVNPTTHGHSLQPFSCLSTEALALAREVTTSLPEFPQWHVLLRILLHHLCHCHIKILLGDVHSSLAKGKHSRFCANSLQNPESTWEIHVYTLQYL